MCVSVWVINHMQALFHASYAAGISSQTAQETGMATPCVPPLAKSSYPAELNKY